MLASNFILCNLMPLEPGLARLDADGTKSVCLSPSLRPWRVFLANFAVKGFFPDSSRDPKLVTAKDAKETRKERQENLPRIVQARSDAIHGGADGVVKRWVGRAGAFAAEQVDLDQAERINIRVAQADRSEEDRILFQ